MSGRRILLLRARIATVLVPLALVLSACEDEGNPGNDNLLTGGSVVVVLIIIVIVVFLVARRRHD